MEMTFAFFEDSGWCKCLSPPCIICGAILARWSPIPIGLTPCFSPRISHGADFATDRAKTEKAGWTEYGFQQGCNFVTSIDCGTTGWGASSSGVASRYSLGSTFWPTYSAGAVNANANGYDVICSYNRRGYANNAFTYKAASGVCNGGATSSSQFGSSCTLPPWHDHFAANNNVVLQWDKAANDAFTNQCPVATNDFLCTDITPSDVRGTSSSANARCFEGTLLSSGYVTSGRWLLNQARCYEHTCTADTLLILVKIPNGGGTKVSITCPQAGGTASAPSGFSGTIECPSFAEFCGPAAAAAAAEARMKNGSALRVKGVIPLRGHAGTTVRVFARGLDASTSLYMQVGNRLTPTDTCSGGSSCSVAALQFTGDATTNAAACSSAGAGCAFGHGFAVDTSDSSFGRFTVPATQTGSVAWPNGNVDLVLQAASGQADTGLASFVIDSAAPVSLKADAMTRMLSTSVLTGSTTELTTGPTHHMCYYHLPRDSAPFVAGTDDDLLCVKRNAYCQGMRIFTMCCVSAAATRCSCTTLPRTLWSRPRRTRSSCSRRASAPRRTHRPASRSKQTVPSRRPPRAPAPATGRSECRRWSSASAGSATASRVSFSCWST
jgi:hypothetical protein